MTRKYGFENENELIEEFRKISEIEDKIREMNGNDIIFLAMITSRIFWKETKKLDGKKIQKIKRNEVSNNLENIASILDDKTQKLKDLDCRIRIAYPGSEIVLFQKDPISGGYGEYILYRDRGYEEKIPLWPSGYRNSSI